MLRLHQTARNLCSPEHTSSTAWEGPTASEHPSVVTASVQQNWKHPGVRFPGCPWGVDAVDGNTAKCRQVPHLIWLVWMELRAVTNEQGCGASSSALTSHFVPWVALDFPVNAFTQDLYRIYHVNQWHVPTTAPKTHLKGKALGQFFLLPTPFPKWCLYFKKKWKCIKAKLFVCMRAHSLSHVQLFVTPWTVAHQAPLSMEFSREQYWSELPFHIPEDLSKPGIEPVSLALAGGFFTTTPPGKLKIYLVSSI